VERNCVFEVQGMFGLDVLKNQLFDGLKLLDVGMP
jgi:hypothetical protein